MAQNKMLIDATHPEETRVVVLRNGRVEEFDFESAARKLLRGNIYLAKVTRVEPSLQAAFVDYGGNRHGFLAFSEIHPDYYTIPVADRQAILDEEAAADAAEEAEADRRADARAARAAAHEAAAGHDAEDDAEDTAIDVSDLLPPETIEPHHATAALDTGSAVIVQSEISQTIVAADETLTPTTPDHPSPAIEDEPPAAAAPEHASALDAGADATLPATESVSDMAPHTAEPAAAPAEAVESVGSDDALEEVQVRPRRRARSYKIQEVIKRRQIILVQVVKEERGTKGAALTTYLSLAGRYTVLMPNTARGGGISRKITNAQDRKRLKAIAQELDVPEGMGLIIRTAGAARTAQEIKRDFEYLLRLWENVRDMTLQSTAPSLVYEEGNLIKRSIRDLYTKDVDEILVAGDDAYREARDFMRMLMPSHAKNVTDYREPEPLFNRHQIERQLNAMFSPFVNLRSGGYLVINQTEALVAIDINSGKSTREFSIEETALNTNLEAADEIARQLKLRDLAGLIVIDFIDMEEKRNNRAVERRLKEALRFDRARIQVGRISHFGLLEMSRQRMRTGVLEGSTTQCPHCQGTGIIRSTESVALAVIRALEDTLIAGGRSSLVATTSAGVALYILNHKRNFVVDMEHRHGVQVSVQASDKMHGSNFAIEKSSAPLIAARRPDKGAVNMDWGFDGEAESPAEETEEVDAGREDGGDQPDTHAGGEENGEQSRGRRRRRRRGGRRDDRPRGEQPDEQLAANDDERPARVPVGEVEDVGELGAGEAVDDDATDHGDGDDDRNQQQGRGEGENGDGGRRRRRRGRRGGRRGGRERDNAPEGGVQAADAQEAGQETGEPERFDDDARHGQDETANQQSHAGAADDLAPPHHPEHHDLEHEAAPAGSHRDVSETEAANGHEMPEIPAEAPVAVEPARSLDRPSTPADQIAVLSTTPDDGKPARKGWWQRRFGGD